MLSHDSVSMEYLDFSNDGVSPEILKDFFAGALKATLKREPIIESGNKYAVSDDFHKMNAALIFHDVSVSSWFLALSSADQARAKEFLQIVLFNSNIRNRNPLHPSVLDACVIGNLLNFPKHIFGFPFGAYGTDGNESLSLVLFAYRARCHEIKAPRVVCVTDETDNCPRSVAARLNVDLCARRLGMEVVEVAASRLGSLEQDVAANAVVVMASLGGGNGLDAAVEWAEARKLSVHVHVTDAQFRSVFEEHAEGPAHFELPFGVRSVSLEEGLFNCGYSLYRDVALRDLHFDVGYAWQTCYMSPNEGGSGASTVLFIDFCVVMLGWSALRDIAKKSGGSASTWSSLPPSLAVATLEPTLLQRKATRRVSTRSGAAGDDGLPKGVPQGPEAFSAIQAWAKAAVEDEGVSRAVLERYLVEFQCHFLGGKGLPVLEACTTGGGTRSINLAFESVLAKAATERGRSGSSGSGSTVRQKKGLVGGASGGGKRQQGHGFKVLTGNPHLAVERAERRFGFELVRCEKGGCVDVSKLRAELVKDLAVVAVYSQTLSFTDGVSDDLPAILQVLEDENERRLSLGAPLVTLINDCCLAFCVLVHNDGSPNHESSNDGSSGGRCLRLLDLVCASGASGGSGGKRGQCVTPCLVTLDAHKHLGTDKGVSTVVGTSGTLAHLTYKQPPLEQAGTRPSSSSTSSVGCVRVGCQPTKGQLVRAVADCLLVGTEGYTAKYKQLAVELKRAARLIEAAGMVVVHSKDRAEGSTVISVEDPSSVLAAKLQKKGHSIAYLFNLYPEDAARCQSGWQLSLTPHCLRRVGSQGKTALDTFLEDLLGAWSEVQAKQAVLNWLGLCFRESSLPAFLLRGGVLDTYLLGQIVRPGVGRFVAETTLRRLFANLLDSGVVCTKKRAAPLRDLASLFLLVLTPLLGVLLALFFSSKR